MVKLERPATGAANLSTSPITDHRDKLLLKAAMTVRGETRTAYFSHARIDGFSTSWKGETFPQVEAGGRSGYSRYGQSGPDYLNFLYGFDGALLCIPLERREKVGGQNRYAPATESSYMTPVALIQRVMREGEKSLDAENRPLTEEEENRLAWLGVEMQGMDPDLARAGNVMDETNGGASGGIVTYIYPNSPATQAGIKESDIVLRLHVEGLPKPMEVNVDESGGFGGMLDQFWANLDRVPEEYFDRLPRPWGNAENALSRSLTDVGFGTAFVADVWRDGKLVRVPMTITQGPAHYDAAARNKSESLGITVRDLTYEVRRYFQMKDDETGVIISKVERGGKGSVGGLKPYETIRTINDEPVTNVKEFERLVTQGGELRMAVKRMTQGRTVKIKANSKGEEKTPDEAADAATPTKQN